MKIHINRIPIGEFKPFERRSGSEHMLRLTGVNVDLSKGEHGNVNATAQGIYTSLFSFRNEGGQVMIDISLWREDWFVSIILMKVRPYIWVGITRETHLEEEE